MYNHSFLEKSSLLHTPNVVGTVIAPATLALATSPQILDLCDVVEFRADALAADPTAMAHAMAACPLPTLLTVRDPAEGGIHDLSTAQRRDLMEQLLPHAHLLDIEIKNLADFSDIIAEAHLRHIPLIASFHHFTATPDLPTLTSLSATARQAGAAVVKFATHLRHTADLATLAALQESTLSPLATMGMGPLGRVSRLLLASLGSVMNYGYLDQPTVPGQWPAARLRTLITELRAGELISPPPLT